MKHFYVNFVPRQGRRHHFYHFFYGVFLPLSRFLMNQKKLHDFTVYVQDCGPMNKHLESHPFADESHRIRIVAKEDMPRTALTIRGSDFPLSTLSYFLENNRLLRKELLAAFGCVGTPSGGTILVDRGQPEDAISQGTVKRLAAAGFTSGKYNDRSGAMRRYLANADRLEAVMTSAGLVYTTVRLEEKTMQEQARIFWNASTIVGQHGAGFANLFFSEHTTRFVEFGAQGRGYFASIAKVYGIPYANVPTFPASNGPCHVNAQRVVKLLAAASQ